MMKKLFIFVLVCAVTSGAFAAAPATTCPAGYVAVTESAITIVNGVCPGGTTATVTATDSCLVTSPAGNCFMYAPANTDFSDPSGTYQFSEICPLR